MAFNLSGILSLNNKGFNAGIKQSESASDKFAKKVDKSASSIKRLVVASTGITGIVAGVTSAVKTFADFEKKMSNVQAITEETSLGAMAQLAEKAKEMGRILPASAGDAADAMSNLGSAGFTTNEIMKSVEGTLYLAASAQTDMATAADITSSTLRGFGLEAGKSNHVADVLAKTSAKTNAGILDMGESMKYAAPVANAMGISLEETAAAIGLMANAGIKGSQSGTTLRGAMIRLTKPMKPAKEAMEAMGFSAFDSAGNMNNLGTIVNDLKIKTKGYTSEQKNAALATIFGQEALSGMLALVDAGPAQLNGLTDALLKSDGAAKKMADTQTNNLYGAMESLKGAWETAQIDIAQKAAPALVLAFKSVADALPGVVTGGLDLFNTAVQWIVTNQDFVVSAISGISGAYASYKAILIGVAAMEGAKNIVMTIGTGITVLKRAAIVGLTAASLSGSKATGVMTAAQFLLNTVMSLNPIGLVVTAIGLMVAGFVLAYKKIEPFRKFIDGLWGALKGAAGALANFFGITDKGAASSISTKVQAKMPANANGTAYSKGGWSQVNERGGEMQVLRNGTSVIPADKTKQLLDGGSKGETNHYWSIDARGMDADELVTTLKLRLANI